MITTIKSTYRLMSAYVALSCLIAFVIVITICLVKQFIWDPILAKKFQVIRPVLYASVRKLSTTFVRNPPTEASSSGIMSKSTSITCIRTSEPPQLKKNLVTVTQSLPADSQQSGALEWSRHHNISSVGRLDSPTTTVFDGMKSTIDYARDKLLTNNGYKSFDDQNEATLPLDTSGGRRSYSSFNSVNNQQGYTNFGSDVIDSSINDEIVTDVNTPILHFSCEYYPTSATIRLNIQNIRNMKHIINSAHVSIRFTILPLQRGLEPYETSLQKVKEFVRFGESFTILKNITQKDLLNYSIRFCVYIHVTETQIYELGEAIYPMTENDDALFQAFYIEKFLPIRQRFKNAITITDDY
ncbi:unnamed protein product [Didymodactylos carnosus]|uniref:Uncharacterized protein n=1 Tax=Didymodactylos carnosus TaxID=1234261 RepID=A0A813U6K5_9BILA|nr:unnamed protein product [Didymodactylos carnosus]CAF3610010.1 unnamed protein product [Didymodactylos carnosus]